MEHHKLYASLALGMVAVVVGFAGFSGQIGERLASLDSKVTNLSAQIQASLDSQVNIAETQTATVMSSLYGGQQNPYIYEVCLDKNKYLISQSPCPTRVISSPVFSAMLYSADFDMYGAETPYVKARSSSSSLPGQSLSVQANFSVYSSEIKYVTLSLALSGASSSTYSYPIAISTFKNMAPVVTFDLSSALPATLKSGEYRFVVSAYDAKKSLIMRRIPKFISRNGGYGEERNLTIIPQKVSFYSSTGGSSTISQASGQKIGQFSLLKENYGSLPYRMILDSIPVRTGSNVSGKIKNLKAVYRVGGKDYPSREVIASPVSNNAYSFSFEGAYIYPEIGFNMEDEQKKNMSRAGEVYLMADVVGGGSLGSLVGVGGCRIKRTDNGSLFCGSMTERWPIWGSPIVVK